MYRNRLTPVFIGLRTGLHGLVAVLLALVVVQIFLDDLAATWAAFALAVAFAGVYVYGARLAALPDRRRMAYDVAWLVTLTLLWVPMLLLVQEAAYLVFPLFFLYLHLLPRRVGPVAVVGVAAMAIVGLALHTGFILAGVIGPLVGAGVAILIGLGHQALVREAEEREALLAELVATRDQLVAAEREKGVHAERSRLAREIHDTVGQGLSSIQLLLHAAERADPDSPGADHVRLARQTAAEGLEETRRFIRELAPPTLAGGLTIALQRLAATQHQVNGLAVDVEVPTTLELSMPTQAALLRIAQGALANVVQHAEAARATIRLAHDGEGLEMVIADDGRGFNPVETGAHTSTASFGLQAMQERIEQLGGTLTVTSREGRGTSITARLDQP